MLDPDNLETQSSPLPPHSMESQRSPLQEKLLWEPDLLRSVPPPVVTELPAPQGPRFGPAEGASSPTTTSTPKAAVGLGRKSVEIIFTSNKRRQQVDQPPPLRDIVCASSIKILSVTISNRLSVSQHVQNVIMS